MNIKFPDLKMTSFRPVAEKDVRRDSLATWQDNNRSDQAFVHRSGPGQPTDRPAQLEKAQAASVHLSVESKRARPPQAIGAQEEEQKPVETVKLDILKSIIEKLTGKKIKILTPSNLVLPERKG